MLKKYIIPVSICVFVLIACIGIMQWRSIDADERMIAGTETAAGETVKLDLNPREEPGAFIIGTDDAPVTIFEFSSLSCPHCASFHKGALSDLKKDYVETGKVKFVFHDFPLNKQAISASLLLKCVPVENRYDFMEMLFEQQGEWAIAPDYQTKLKQYAALMGIGSEAAQTCMNDSAKEKAMFATMQNAHALYEIKSTPTFVIQPGNIKLLGNRPYGDFSTRIEKLLKESE